MQGRDEIRSGHVYCLFLCRNKLDEMIYLAAINRMDLVNPETTSIERAMLPSDLRRMLGQQYRS